MIIVLQANWKVWTLFNGKNRVYMKCPRCGIECALDHDVDVHGNVTPSVICPNPLDGKPCSFHEMVQLEGWSLGLHAGTGWA